MLRCTVLPRLLLCLAFVFNGVASASASVHAMASGMPAVEIDAVAIAASGASAGHCHEYGTAMPAVATQAADMAMHDHAAGKPDSPASPDCCKSGACQCDCAQIASLLMPAETRAGAVFVRAPAVVALAFGHANPALPDPIRPPIG